ncbi:MAG: membrane-bound lytic murein transglycosylase MltF [Candidatus Paceibacteria bacterium]
MVALLALLACGEEAPSLAAPTSSGRSVEVLALDHGDLPELVESKRLRVLVPYAQPFYFIDGGRPRGISVEIFREYGEFLEQAEGLRKGDMSVVFIPCELGSMLSWLNAGYGDIAAASLTVTPQRELEVKFSDPVTEGLSEIVVVHENAAEIESLEELAGRVVWATAGSSYIEHLRSLSEEFEARGLDPIRVHEAPSTLSTEDLLEMVHAGILELTVCDDYKAKLWAQVLPGMRLHEELVVHSGGQIAWAVRPDSPKLLANLNEFVAVARKGTLLGNILIKRYFKTTKWIQDPNDAEGRERIERYAGWMKELALEYEFDWLRIAAQCYQESGLDPNAVSSAGAVGLMQLLPSTGEDMECGDLRDPKENLRAGVRYLDWLRTNFFADPELAEDERMDFILAAYNAGPGNVRKWRKMAPGRGLDPMRWRNNVEILAFEGVGVQPIRYVNNIEKFFVAYSLASDLIAERDRYDKGE